MDAMRAIVVTRFGDFGVLRAMQVPPPEVEPGQLLVQVEFAGVNHVDWQLREGWYAAAEKVTFPYVPGWAVAGTVVETGAGVASFAAHDRVFAYCRGPCLHGGGSYCELMALDAAIC